MHPLLKKLDCWCKTQKNIRLVVGPPASDKTIDEIPKRLEKKFRNQLPVLFKAESFLIPESYRSFLKQHSQVQLEFLSEGKWQIYEPFQIFSPSQVEEGHSFCYASLDERLIDTSFLIAFATAGFKVEGSRWCLVTDPKLRSKPNELPILLEDNDFECTVAKFADTGEWVPGANNPIELSSFEEWLEAIVLTIVTRKFKYNYRDDAVPNTLLVWKSKGMFKKLRAKGVCRVL